MKTRELPTHKATQTFLAERVTVSGDVLIGLRFRDRSELAPKSIRDMQIVDTTGERVLPPALVYGTQDPTLATFYGAVRGIVRAANIRRGSATKAIRDSEGNVAGYAYYL